MYRRDDWISKTNFEEQMAKNKLQLEDFYWEDNKMVLTEVYHLKRGKCCSNDCRHCPYK